LGKQQNKEIIADFIVEKRESGAKRPNVETALAVGEAWVGAGLSSSRRNSIKIANLNWKSSSSCAAIARDELHLVYQPVITVANNSIGSVEALLRQSGWARSGLRLSRSPCWHWQALMHGHTNPRRSRIDDKDIEIALFRHLHFPVTGKLTCIAANRNWAVGLLPSPPDRGNFGASITGKMT
jgi:hypothetical protein